jgi:hypothetical protein
MAERSVDTIKAAIDHVRSLGLDRLRARWRTMFGATPPAGLTKDLLRRMIAYRIQEEAFGGIDPETIKLLDGLARGEKPCTKPTRSLKAGTVLVREYQGERHTVTVVPDGFVWRETTYPSLSTIARAITATAWGGPRFFGLRSPRSNREDNKPDQKSATPQSAKRVGVSGRRTNNRNSEVQA